MRLPELNLSRYFPTKKESIDRPKEEEKVKLGELANQFLSSPYWNLFFKDRLGDKRLLDLAALKIEPINGMAPDVVGYRALLQERVSGRMAELQDILYDLRKMMEEGESAKKRLSESKVEEK